MSYPSKRTAFRMFVPSFGIGAPGNARLTLKQGANRNTQIHVQVLKRGRGTTVLQVRIANECAKCRPVATQLRHQDASEFVGKHGSVVGP